MAGLCRKHAQLRQEAKEIVSEACFHFIDGGAEDEITQEQNRSQWSKIKLVPRFMRDVSVIDTRWTFLDQQFAAPLIVAPMSLQGWVHPDAECATAGAATSCGLPLGLSMWSSKGFDEVLALDPKPMILAQIYMLENRAFMKSYFQQLYAHGVRCVILTVDAPRVGNREGMDFKIHEKESTPLAFIKSPLWAEHGSPSDTFASITQTISPSMQWDSIAWIKEIVDVQVFVKGLLSPADALLALESGADGIIVSNHGGRQLDTSITGLEALPGIAQVIQGSIPLLVDGGIQRGTDIIKALALGASGVLIGRIVLYALAVDGEVGVKNLLDSLLREFSVNLSLCGCQNLKDITKNLIFNL